MSETHPVYDLGEIAPAPRAAPLPNPGTFRVGPAVSGSSVPALAGTLSLLVPGAGHLLLREPTGALFFASLFGLAVSVAWALANQLPRLVGTLELLDVPVSWAAAGLAISGGAAALLHVSSVVVAHRDACTAFHPAPAGPAVSGLASAVVPGWGQVLGGRPGIGAGFLVLAWGLAAAWLSVTPPIQALFRSARVGAPGFVTEEWAPTALITATALLWAIAIYDAAAGARRARLG